MHSKPPKYNDLDCNFHHLLSEKEVGWRTDLKELNVVQPEGPSFSVSGNDVTWQKWHIRVGFNAREGLTLHNIG